MGARGPVPQRSDQRRRRNKPDGGEITAIPGAVKVEQPAADDLWHPMARDWYVSLAESGQATFYQPSDWQTARIWAEVLTRQLNADKISAVMIASWSAGATELLTTEGARRRVRLELQRATTDPDEEASIHALADYRAALDA